MGGCKALQAHRSHTAEKAAAVQPSSYTYTFSDSDVRELAAAVDKIKARGVSTEEAVQKVAHLLCSA